MLLEVFFGFPNLFFVDEAHVAEAAVGEFVHDRSS